MLDTIDQASLGIALALEQKAGLAVLYLLYSMYSLAVLYLL